VKLRAQTDPFPFAVEDGLWDSDLLQLVLETEFPPPSSPLWKRYDGANEHKLEGSNTRLFGPATRKIFGHFRDLADDLSESFDLPPLSMELVGGGYHLIPPGGYLNVHTDFNRSPNTGLYRRVNLLIYLNKDWQLDEGGCLELWDDDQFAVRVLPEFNRTVAFVTSSRSWHGHPIPNTRARRSLAAYFYSAEPPPDYDAEQSTVWHPKAPRI
jgi:Rps23 Pro-64 3,4-dihydroxylase Tpa1-like proline 4-hydroxylase